ncbi:MAG: (2Fe-2S)-binding protein [Deltaproteobacteria bacterium]|nr:(2Fe-2S)-binding protein [Deltaproteobacteria bacterium]
MAASEADLGRSPVALTINGRRTVLDAAPGERLLDALRRAGWLDIKESCGEGECGSCTVLLDGRAVCSCLLLAQSAEGADVVTAAATGHRVVGALRRAFVEEMGTQCGFCTPGMVLAAADLLTGDGDPDEAKIRRALAGNLCRCTGYHRILRAVQRAAAELREEVQP